MPWCNRSSILCCSLILKNYNKSFFKNCQVYKHCSTFLVQCWLTITKVELIRHNWCDLLVHPGVQEGPAGRDDRGSPLKETHENIKRAHAKQTNKARSALNTPCQAVTVCVQELCYIRSVRPQQATDIFSYLWETFWPLTCEEVTTATLTLQAKMGPSLTVLLMCDPYLILSSVWAAQIWVFSYTVHIW